MSVVKLICANFVRKQKQPRLERSRNIHLW